MDAELKKVVSELQLKLGRNVLRFQQIEAALKTLTPYVHPDGSAQGWGGAIAMLTHLQDKPLGTLIEKLMESLDAPSRENMEQPLKKLLSDRNQVVHHFFQIPGVSINTIDGARTGIRHLDQQFNQTEDLHKILSLQAAAVLLRVVDTYSQMDPTLAEYRQQIIERHFADVEFIDLEDPNRTIWRNTRIVKLLQRAEVETPKTDGMTLLSRAGAFIQRTDPTLTFKEYGVKSLSAVLAVCGLFHVERRPMAGGTGETVLYRSRTETD